MDRRTADPTPSARSDGGAHRGRATLVALALIAIVVVPSEGALAAEPACGPLVEGVHEVSTIAHLGAVGSGGAGSGECALGASYRLMNDLNLEDVAYNGPVIAGTFTGTFDGGGNTIRNMRIVSQAYGSSTGLFEELDDAMVRDIELAAPSVEGGAAGSSSLPDATGALVGRAVGGSIRNVTIRDADIKGDGDVGGLLGAAQGALHIEGVRVTGGTIAGDQTRTFSYSGGVIGRARFVAESAGAVRVELRDIRSSATVTGRSRVGGMFGELQVNAGSSCQDGASVEVVLTDVHVGGGAEITSADPGGSRGGRAGGLAGRANVRAVCAADEAALHITDSTVAATVRAGNREAGGFFGSIQTATGGPMIVRMNGVTFAGDVEGRSEVGGIVGEIRPGEGVDVRIEEVSVTGSVSGTSQVGGIVGKAGFLPADGSRGEVLVRRSSVRADIAGSSDDVGGLAGVIDGAVLIEQSVFVGEVLNTAGGRQETGGAVGDLRGGAALRDVLLRGAITFVDTAGRVGSVAGEIQTGSSVLRSLSVMRIETASGGGLAFRRVSSTFDDEDVVEVRVANDVPGNTVTPAVDSGPTPTGVFLQPRSELRLLSTFAAWPIVDGWVPAGGSAVWGICAGVNDGFPFLLWQFASDPCPGPPAPVGPSLACAPAPAVGVEVECTVTGGPVDHEILWEASFNPVFASAGVLLDGNGTGSFAFTVPAAALGRDVLVELVEWTAPVSLGAATPPVPASVPAGEGRVPFGPLGLALAVTVLALLRAGRPQVRRAP